MGWVNICTIAYNAIKVLYHNLPMRKNELADTVIFSFVASIYCLVFVNVMEAVWMPKGIFFKNGGIHWQTTAL